MVELVLRFLEGDGNGIITTAEAEALGCSPAMLRGMVRAKLLERVGRGVYVSAALLNPPPDSELGRDRFALGKHRHLLRLDAFLRLYDKKVAASHQSAVLAWGLPTEADSLDLAHLVRTRPGGTLRHREGYILHTCGLNDVITSHEGRRVVVAPLAVIGQALVVGLQAGVEAMDAAIAKEHTTKEELDGMLTKLRHTPRLSIARKALSLADGLAESPGETRLRMILIELGVAFIAQHWVRIDGTTVHYRVDFYLPELGVILEYDGQVKYGRARDDDPPRQRKAGDEAGREALVREKAREDDLRREGFGVGRITSQSLSPQWVTAIIGSAQQQAQPSARHRRAEQPAWLRGRRRSG